ncbi:MAG: aldo/keto reductase [Candidatus Pacearchaeota archaeon]|nr:aldo/keto reductase [Candidatus Pacearchaeota archaeon]
MKADLKQRLVYGTYRIPLGYSEFFRILEACYRQGILWLDTSPIYNAGLSEIWIRHALQNPRLKFKVATKIGKFYNTNGRLEVNLDPDRLLTAIKESQGNLGNEKLDLVFLHNYDGKTSADDLAKTLEGLLRKNGPATFGTSNFPIRIWKFLAKRGLIGCIQRAYGEAKQVEEEALLAQRLGIDCWLYRPFYKGELIKAGGNPKELLVRAAKRYPQSKIIFGASRETQVKQLLGL